MGRDTDFDYGANVAEPDYNTHDPPTYDCMGRVTCGTCGKFHGYCAEIKNFNNYSQGGSNVNVGKHMTGAGTGDRNPFIQAEQVSVKGTKFTIISVREVNSPARKAAKGKKASNGFHGLMIDVKNGTHKYCLPVRYDRFDLANIVKQMKSEDTDDWMGKKIKLIRVKGSQGGNFVNVAQ